MQRPVHASIKLVLHAKSDPCGVGRFNQPLRSAPLSIAIGTISRVEVAIIARVVVATRAASTPAAPTRRGRRRPWCWSVVGREPPIGNVGRVHVAVLLSTPALIAIHPIHVLCEPIASHESHALLDLLQHGVELAAARAHAERHLATFLAQGGGEGEVVTIDVEPLRVRERLSAVDRVAWPGAEVAGTGLRLRIAPLVAFPVWVATVVFRASMICHLLHFHVSLIHVKLRTATKSVKTLRITIIVMVIAFGGPGHANQVEIQVTTASWAIPLEINVDGEGLASEARKIEIVSAAVVRGETFHQIEPVWRSILNRQTIIRDSRPREKVGIHHPVLVDDEFSLLSIGGLSALVQVRHAVLYE